MDDFPEPNDAELAEYSKAWELSEKIDEIQLRIAERKSTPATSQHDLDLRDASLAEMDLELAKLEAQRKAPYPSPPTRHRRRTVPKIATPASVSALVETMASERKSATTSPRFSINKEALIAYHKHACQRVPAPCSSPRTASRG